MNDLYQPPTEGKKGFHTRCHPQKKSFYGPKTKLIMHKLNQAIEDERLAEQMYMELKNLLRDIGAPEEAGIILIAQQERDHLQTLVNIRSSILQYAPPG